jgi:hypothetical protein
LTDVFEEVLPKDWNMCKECERERPRLFGFKPRPGHGSKDAEAYLKQVLTEMSSLETHLDNEGK